MGNAASVRRLRLGVVLAVAIAAGQGYSDTYTWKGGSGNWSNPANWTGGAANTYPGHASNDVAKIAVNTEPITVTVDVTTVLTQLVFVADSDAVSKPVTLAGGGSLRLTASLSTSAGSSLVLSDNRKCILATSINVGYAYLNASASLAVEAGGDLYHRSSIAVYGKLAVNDGSINTSSGATTVKNGAMMVQSGGYVYTRLNLEAGGSFVQDGGTFHNRFRGDTINDDGEFVLNGGTFRQSGVWTTNCLDWASRIYPVKKGTVTDILYYSGYGNATKYFNPFGQTNCDYVAADTSLPPAFTNDYPFAGTLMCTNSTSTSGYPCFLLRSAKATIGRPGGALVCDSIGLSGLTSEIDFRLSKIVLKKSFDINNNSTQINFPNGIEFGAFGGDWSMSAKSMTLTSPAAVNLYGDCVIDTTDYLDGATGRSIALYNLFAGRNRTSLTVKGCGVATANLGTNGYDSFRKITVKADATLILDRYSSLSTFRTVLANELELESGATLCIGVGRTPIDAIRSKIAADAKIRVTVFSSTEAARKILVASLGDVEGGIDESNFEIDNQGSVVWQIARSGNTFYLTDGSPAQPPTSLPPSSGSARYAWTGAAGNGSWSDAGNWMDSHIPNYPNYNSEYVDFYDAACWSVTNDCKDSFEVRLLTFAATGNGGLAAGPFILSGKSLKIRAGNAVYNEGDWRFPAIINNQLVAVSFFNSSASKDNSVTIAGGLKETTSYTALNGDWRLGGTVTTKAFVSGKRTNENARPDKFTILSNATVTVSNQGTTTNNYAAAFRYNIERTGLLNFTGGTSLDFPAGFESAYHTIYGTLDVGIPLKFGVDQHFHGTGDVKVQSVAEFAATKARVHLSGGVTLKPAAWTTATTADGVTAITVDGAATIRPTADITYGASSDAVTSTAEERALEITDAGELTLVADAGRTVTLTDPIAGEGKLTISGPGTVSLAGGVSVGELAFSGSPKIKVGGETIVTATTAISLDGVEIVVPYASAFANWTTVVSAPKISGTPTVPSNVKASVAVVGDHMELQLKGLRGLLLSIH